ncbi:MAG: class I SAM-dependent methyltransferase [Solirubrobacteraceae bacterium]
MTYRQESRVRWGRSARGWEARAEALSRATMPVSAWMVDAIAPQPGHVLLELAAGLGDTGFLAAELIEPGGTLICSDLVPEMLSAAQRRAEALGLRNVRFRQIDAEAIDQPAASLDGVLCRWGYMLLADPDAALLQTRRVLRPGGRLALAAWTGADDNRWSAQPIRELVARGLMDEPDPSGPGQFTWSREGAVAEHLEAAGFVEHHVEVVDFHMRYRSVQDWWDSGRDMSLRFNEATAALDPAVTAEVQAALARAAAPWTGDDGTIAVPARTWVAVAGA